MVNTDAAPPPHDVISKYLFIIPTLNGIKENLEF